MKKKAYILIIFIVFLFAAFLLLLINKKPNYNKIINKLESENYIFSYTELPNHKNTVLLNWNDRIYIQKIEKDDSITYYFWDMNIPDSEDDYGIAIYPLEDHTTLKKDKQFKSYKKWLKEHHLTDKQIIQLLDYYEENYK